MINILFIVAAELLTTRLTCSAAQPMHARIQIKVPYQSLCQSRFWVLIVNVNIESNSE